MRRPTLEKRKLLTGLQGAISRPVREITLICRVHCVPGIRGAPDVGERGRPPTPFWPLALVSFRSWQD